MAKGPTPSRKSSTPIGRDLEQTHELAVGLLAQHGLAGWSVFWAESLIEKDDAAGATHVHARRIVFSAGYMAMLTPAGRRDAAYHEVAHAIVGVAAGHSEVWEEKARELGGTGKTTPNVDHERFPWIGFCPSGHAVPTVRRPGTADIRCEDGSHEEPTPVGRWKKMHKSKFFDGGARKMVETYPEPPSVPKFEVGDVVYLIPFGSEKEDNARLTVLEVRERHYLVRVDATGNEILARHESVSGGPQGHEPAGDA